MNALIRSGVKMNAQHKECNLDQPVHSKTRKQCNGTIKMFCRTKASLRRATWTGLANPSKGPGCSTLCGKPIPSCQRFEQQCSGELAKVEKGALAALDEPKRQCLDDPENEDIVEAVRDAGGDVGAGQDAGVEELGVVVPPPAKKRKNAVVPRA
eukprot:5630541-Amphidinium_carterae.1